MRFRGYIKERWYMFVVIVIAAIFVISVCVLDKQALFANTSAAYILSGIALFLLIYVFIDYLIIKHRVKNLSAFIKNGGIEEFDFTYPSDILLSVQINKLTNEYNRYRAKIAGASAEDLEFITKWVHDVKVPISAMKLLLESDSDNLKKRLEMELLSIEQNTQKVLFSIKSKSFYDDYKIAKASTKSLINNSLKQFSTFFSFKKINLKMDINDYMVLTDKKWSGYIISQFLSNAIKHTPDSGEISIDSLKTDAGIEISVTNTGEGIDKRDLNQVFNRGYTSSNRHHTKATGYGLFLSKKLADKLGHNIYVKSECGKYAKFVLVIKQP